MQHIFPKLLVAAGILTAGLASTSMASAQPALPGNVTRMMQSPSRQLVAATNYRYLQRLNGLAGSPLANSKWAYVSPGRHGTMRFDRDGDHEHEHGDHDGDHEHEHGDHHDHEHEHGDHHGDHEHEHGDHHDHEHEHDGDGN